MPFGKPWPVTGFVVVGCHDSDSSGSFDVIAKYLLQLDFTFLQSSLTPAELWGKIPILLYGTSFAQR